MENKKKSMVTIADLYGVALRRTVEIEDAIDAKISSTQRQYDPKAPRYEVKELQKSAMDFTNKTPFPHQSTFFAGDTPMGAKAADKVSWFTVEIDRRVAEDLDLQRLCPRAAVEKKQPSVWENLCEKFRRQNTGPSLDALRMEGMEMRNVLRVLKVAQAGVEPGSAAVVNKGYFTPKIMALFLERFPKEKSLEEWQAVATKTLDAMKPTPYDEGVVSVYWPEGRGPSGFPMPEGENYHSHSFGVTLLRYGYNEHGISLETERYTIKQRFAYSHNQIHFKNRQEAELAFAGVMRAETLGEVADALRTKEDESCRRWIAKFRRTRAGNFVGGSFNSDAGHPSPIVAHAAQHREITRDHS